MEETRKPARKPRAAKPAVKPAAKAKPAAQPAATPAAKQDALDRKTVARRAPAKAGPATPSSAPPDREERVRLAAYFRAQRRGFAPGHEWEDWLAAERELTASTAPASAPQARKTREG